MTTPADAAREWLTDRRYFIVPPSEATVASLAALIAAQREAAYAEGVEAAANVAEGGNFLHDAAPDAIFGRACAGAIRRLRASDADRRSGTRA